MRTEGQHDGFQHMIWQDEPGPELCSKRRVLGAIPLYLAYLCPELTRVAIVLADPRGEDGRTGVLVCVPDSEQTVSPLELLLEAVGLAKVKGFITPTQASAAEAQLWRMKACGGVWPSTLTLSGFWTTSVPTFCQPPPSRSWRRSRAPVLRPQSSAVTCAALYSPQAKPRFTPFASVQTAT